MNSTAIIPKINVVKTLLAISLIAFLLFAIGRADPIDYAPSATDDTDESAIFHVMILVQTRIHYTKQQLFEIGYTGSYDDCFEVWQELEIPQSLIVNHPQISFYGTLQAPDRQVHTYVIHLH